MVLRLQEQLLHDRSRGQDPRDLALDQLFGVAGVFHLFADGDLVPLFHEPGDVAVDGMVGDPAHGDGSAALVPVARGEGDFQVAGRLDGVLVEHLVEIAQAEKDQLVGVAPLDLVVLLHHRGEVFVCAHFVMIVDPPGCHFVGPQLEPAAKFGHKTLS